MSTALTTPHGRHHPTGPLRRSGRVLWDTVGALLRYRVTGLAAEVAFFTLLSLPPLIFGLTGAIGFVARRFSLAETEEFRSQALTYAERFLTPDTVEQLIAPTLDEVLGSSRVDIVSIGFLVAVWSGSRAMAVFADTITIMFGLAGARSIVRTRILSFGVYLAFLIGGAILIPLVMVGPGMIRRLLPEQLSDFSLLYWPVVLIASIAVLMLLFHFATPVRHHWRAHLPGAALTIILWLIGSAVLRWALITLTGGTSIFGPLATPIALLAWLYLIAFAALSGASLNAAITKEAPRWAGITDSQAEHLLEDIEDDDEDNPNSPAA